MSRKNPLPVRSANTLRVPITEGGAASIAVPIFSISAKSASGDLQPDGRADAGRQHVDPSLSSTRSNPGIASRDERGGDSVVGETHAMRAYTRLPQSCVRPRSVRAAPHVGPNHSAAS